MRGIIYKDLYDNFGVWKNLISYILFIIFISAWTILLSDSTYYFVLQILIFNILGACAMESSSEQDEAANFNRLLISFPVTKKEIVTAKYLLALIFIAVSNGFALCAAAGHVLLGGVLGFAEVMPIWLLGLYTSLIFTGISYVAYMIYGKRKGTIFYVFLIVLIAGGYGAVSAIYGIQRFVEMDKTLVLWAGLPVSVFVFMISWWISVKVYNRKYS